MTARRPIRRSRKQFGWHSLVAFYGLELTEEEAAQLAKAYKSSREHLREQFTSLMDAEDGNQENRRQAFQELRDGEKEALGTAIGAFLNGE